MADEVRKLAERTMSATKEVTTNVDSTRSVILRSTAQMEKAATAVEHCVTMSAESRESLEEIASLSREAEAGSQEILLQSEAQATTAEQVDSALHKMNMFAATTCSEVQKSLGIIARLVEEMDQLKQVTHSCSHADSSSIRHEERTCMQATEMAALETGDGFRGIQKAIAS